VCTPRSLLLIVLRQPEKSFSRLGAGRLSVGNGAAAAWVAPACCARPAVRPAVGFDEVGMGDLSSRSRSCSCPSSFLSSFASLPLAPAAAAPAAAVSASRPPVSSSPLTAFAQSPANLRCLLLCKMRLCMGCTDNVPALAPAPAFVPAFPSSLPLPLSLPVPVMPMPSPREYHG